VVLKREIAAVFRVQRDPRDVAPIQYWLSVAITPYFSLGEYRANKEKRMPGSEPRRPRHHHDSERETKDARHISQA